MKNEFLLNIVSFIFVENVQIVFLIFIIYIPKKILSNSLFRLMKGES